MPSANLQTLPALPCDICKGQCCAFAPMTMGEFKTIRRVLGIPRGATLRPMTFREGRIPGVPAGSPGVMVIKAGSDGGVCAFLDERGRCMVHSIRPRGCRIYGTIDALPCAYLYPERAKAVTRSLLDGIGLIPAERLTR